MPFKYPFSVKIELTLKCFIFLLSQLSLFLYLLFIYKLIIFYFILIVWSKVVTLFFCSFSFFLFYLQVVCVILLYLVLFCFHIWECLGPEIRNTYCIPTILVCAGLLKRVKKRDSTKERDCMGGGGEVVSTGLVAWLVAPFSPTIHPYCSQSYLGVVADDK